MKRLFRAKEIHQEIIKLDENIIELERLLDNAIENKLDCKLSLEILNKPAESKDDKEDGGLGFADYILFTSSGGNCSSDSKKDYENEITNQETIIIFASLLRYKQEKRKSLIKEFNSLELKLKI